MKVKELIALLQECPPDAHVICSGGAIKRLQIKPGYYDGYYHYLEKSLIDGSSDDVLVRSGEGEKVVISTIEREDIAYQHKGILEKVKQHLRFEVDTTSMKKVSNTFLETDDLDDENEILDELEQECETIRDQEAESMKLFGSRVNYRYHAGMKAAQSIQDPIGKMHVMWWHKDGDTQISNYDTGIHDGIVLGDRLCQGECKVIIKSGEFSPMEHEIEGRGRIIVWNPIASTTSSSSKV